MAPRNISVRGMAESLIGLSLIGGVICIAPGLLVLVIGLFVRPRRTRIEPRVFEDKA
jgi:hypothetical protein